MVLDWMVGQVLARWASVESGGVLLDVLGRLFQCGLELLLQSRLLGWV